MVAVLEVRFVHMIIFYEKVIEKLQKKLDTKGLTKKQLRLAFGLTEWHIYENSNERIV